MNFIIIFSLMLSILHSILFYGNELGVSVLLYTITSLFIIIKLLDSFKKISNKKALLICIPIILLSSTYLLFQNEIFTAINTIVIFILFGIMILLATTQKKNIDNIIEKLFFLFVGPLSLIKTATRVINKNIFRKKTKKYQKNKQIYKQILKGFLVSLPLVGFVFILLLSADDTFANIFSKIFGIIFENLEITTIFSWIVRIGTIIILTLYGIAFILNIIFKTSQYNYEEKYREEKKKIYINEFTIIVLLVLLNIIYLIFTLAQFSQLSEQIQEFTLSYSEYARSGFFQLMIVSFINLVIIFITNINTKEVPKKLDKMIKFMNILLAMFTIIILIFSIIRMKLYENCYGYTFLRLMVYCIQITELVLIIPTIAYIINKKIRIGKIYFLIITISYVLINFINVDKFIAQKNIDRFMKIIESNSPTNYTEAIDVDYLWKLSNDAIPEIARLLEIDFDNLGKDYKMLENRIRYYFSTRKNELEEKEKNIWEYNISFEKAKTIVKEYE